MQKTTQDERKSADRLTDQYVQDRNNANRLPGQKDPNPIQDNQTTGNPQKVGDLAAYFLHQLKTGGAGKI